MQPLRKKWENANEKLISAFTGLWWTSKSFYRWLRLAGWKIKFHTRTTHNFSHSRLLILISAGKVKRKAQNCVSQRLFSPFHWRWAWFFPQLTVDWIHLEAFGELIKQFSLAFCCNRSSFGAGAFKRLTNANWLSGVSRTVWSWLLIAAHTHKNFFSVC